jgi:hypothetical protein
MNDFTGTMSSFIVKNEREIAQDIFQDSVTSQYCKTVVNAKGEYQMSSAEITSITQPFQKAFTAKGAPAFTAQKIQVRRCKIDMTIYPDEIMDTWLGFLADEKLEPKDYPIVKYIIDKMVVPQIQEDRETEMIYTGVYKAIASEGTAGDAADCYDGFEKQMNDYDTASVITPIALGTITTANAFDKIETFHDALPFKWQQKEMKVFMSDTIRKWAARDRRASYGQNMNYDPTTQNAKIDFTNHTIVGLPSMASKQRIFTTPSWNMIRLYDQRDPAQRLNFTIESEKRAVHVMADWHEAVGFAIPSLVYMSDGDIE